MTSRLPVADELERARRLIQELETRLEESEETLDAIRRGDIDAVVVSGATAEQRVYTLENADQPYRVLIEQIQEGAVTLDRTGTIFYANRRLASLLGMPQERIVGRGLLPFILPDDQPLLAALLAGAANQSGMRSELTLVGSGGTLTPVYLSLSVLPSDSNSQLFCGVVTDLTQQKLHVRALSDANAKLVAESEQRLAVEEALRQSQKMEAVGQLTGGLAHDFNNLLTGIAGSLELLDMRVAQGRFADLHRYTTAALGACQRAASLTHRLLAFSRRQTLDPRPIAVNQLVAGMEEMVQRTMGPQVTVEVTTASGLWNTLVDPNQLENALLNLCINSRDAMPDGGRLTILTANCHLEPADAAGLELPPGDYVCLSVTDTGTGMAPAVIARAFDPFFTTKPIGQGTGLGLSMIYGFALQSGGQARIASRLGHGTTVHLYLPRHHGVAENLERPPLPPASARAEQGETVLIVDDEPTVRMMVTDVLEDLGYAAIGAADGAAGLRVVQSDARIDLLITDVGLPGALNGLQVAESARALRPGLEVLLITGYAENAGLTGGHLDPGLHVLTKPFAINALTSRVRELLTRPGKQ